MQKFLAAGILGMILTAIGNGRVATAAECHGSHDSYQSGDHRHRGYEGRYGHLERGVLGHWNHSVQLPGDFPSGDEDLVREAWTFAFAMATCLGSLAVFLLTPSPAPPDMR
jgi:hypothetical protein